MYAIVAVDEKWGIGRDNRLLFHLPADLKRFKELTSGHTVLMGRKTLATARNLVRTFVPAIPSALFRSCSPFWDLCGKAISFYSYSVGIDTSKISIPRRKAYSTV